MGNINLQGDDTVTNASDESSVLLESSISELSLKESPEPRDTTKADKANVLESSINALGLALGGPVPEHVDIDWNFPFHFDANENAE